MNLTITLGTLRLRYKIQDTNQFIGNLVGWIVIYIIHKTIQAENKTTTTVLSKILFQTIECSHNYNYALIYTYCQLHKPHGTIEFL